MTKKDYIKFAELLKFHKPTMDEGKNIPEDVLEMYEKIKYSIIKLFENDNPNFDSSRFIDYINK